MVSPELTAPEYFHRIQQIIKNPPHHSSALLSPFQAQVLPSLLQASQVFVREDSSKPPLFPLQRSLYSNLLFSKVLFSPGLFQNRLCLHGPTEPCFLNVPDSKGAPLLR